MTKLHDVGGTMMGNMTIVVSSLTRVVSGVFNLANFPGYTFGLEEDWAFTVEDLVTIQTGRAITFRFGSDFGTALLERQKIVKLWEECIADLELPKKPLPWWKRRKP